MRASQVLCVLVALAALVPLPNADAQNSAAAADSASATGSTERSDQRRIAADGQPAGEGQLTEEVVVRGRRMDEIDFDLRIYAREFVGEVAAPPPGRGYARWHQNVCVGVHNLARPAAQYLVDRISRLAVEAGLEPGEPGCTPEVIVIFTADGQAVASQMVEESPGTFRPVATNGHTGRTRAELAEFAEAERAIRWWHVSMPVDARTGQPAIRIPGSGGVEGNNTPVINVPGPSRIHSGIRDELRRAIIIVDSSRLPDTTWQQLGDYLAVISLVQIDPDADPSAFDSILNLFSNPQAYSGLTDWDRSYVQALYAFNQERRPDIQLSELVSRMVRREVEAGR